VFSQTSIFRGITQNNSEDQNKSAVWHLGCGLENQGRRVLVLVGARFFSSPKCPHSHWSTQRLIFNAYYAIFAQGKNEA
jgi:hypothetical protein